LPVLNRLSCHSIHEHTAIFWKMNTKHQARKPVNECQGCKLNKMSPVFAETAGVDTECQGVEGQIAPACQTSWRSVVPLPRYRDFSIFKMAAVRHVLFQKARNFNGPYRPRWIRSNCVTMPNLAVIGRSNHCRDIAVFDFQYGGRASTIFNF